MNLFGSGRQRGTGPPGSSEYQLHCAVVDTCKRWLSDGWIFFHAPNGEHRSKATAAKLVRMGVLPGLPDLCYLGPRGEICWIELKARAGRLSEAQAAVAAHLVAAGHGYLCSSDYRDVIETLKGWGVVRACISVQ
jgi:hypothetical protein